LTIFKKVNDSQGIAAESKSDSLMLSDKDTPAQEYVPSESTVTGRPRK